MSRIEKRRGGGRCAEAIDEVTLSEVRLSEVRPPEVRLSEVTLSAVRLSEVGPPEVRVSDVRPLVDALVVDVVDKESDVFRRKVGFDCSHVPQRGVRRQSAAERERTPMNAVARSRWAWHPQCDAPCRRMTWRFDILGIARRVSPARAAGAARGHTRISAGTARGTGPQT